MRKVLLLICLLLFSVPIEAQVTPPSSTFKVVSTCGAQSLTPGANSGPFMDITGAECSSATLSGTISGNAAAGLTGSNPPGSAGYTGVKDTSSGFLAGVTGTVVGGSEAMNVNILGGAATGVAQGSTTSGQTGGLIQAAATTSAPTYSNGTTNPLSLDTAGNLRVNVVAGGGGTTNIVQQAGTNLGTPTAYGTAPTGNALSSNSFVTNLVVDAANQATATSAPLPVGVVFFSGGNTLTNGQVGYMAGDSLSRAIVNVGASVLPTGAATGVTQGSTTSGQPGTLMQGAVTTSAPTYTTAQTSPLSLDTAGNLRVNVAAGGGSGGTSSTFASAFPGTGTAIGVKNGSNMVNLTADSSSNLNTGVVAWAGGTLGTMANYGTSPGAVLVPGVNANVTNIASDAAVGAAPTSNPPPMGCIAGATTVSSGQMNIISCDTAGHPFTVPWPGTLKSGAVTSAMTGTTSTQVIAAVTSSYLYISSCTVSNASTTVSTDIILQDGSGGTPIWTIPAPAAAVATTGGGGSDKVFPIPLRVPTNGNGLFAANVTSPGTPGTKISCNGFASAVAY